MFVVADLIPHGLIPSAESQASLIAPLTFTLIGARPSQNLSCSFEDAHRIDQVLTQRSHMRPHTFP